MGQGTCPRHPPFAIETPQPQRIEHETAQELGIEIGALGGHLLEVRRNRLDMVHTRGRDEAGQVTATFVQVGRNFLEQVNIAASGGFGRLQERLQHELVEDAHPQRPPLGAMLGDELVHGRVRPELCDQPAAVRPRSEGEHVLIAAHRNLFPGRATTGLTLIDDLHVELGGEELGEFFRRETREAGDQPVGRQDQETGVAHPDQHHHAEVGLVVGAGQLARGGEIVAELHAGLVAMVAVGDEDRLGGHQTLDRGVDRRVGDQPELILNTEVIGRLEWGPVANSRFGGPQDFGFRVGVEAEDRAQVVFGGVEEGESIRLGAGQGLLVRVDLPLPEGLEANPGQEPLRVWVCPSTSKVWW